MEKSSTNLANYTFLLLEDKNKSHRHFYLFIPINLLNIIIKTYYLKYQCKCLNKKTISSFLKRENTPQLSMGIFYHSENSFLKPRLFLKFLRIIYTKSISPHPYLKVFRKLFQLRDTKIRMTFKVVSKVSKTRVKDPMIPYSLIFRKSAKIQSQRYKKSFQLRNFKLARKKQKAWICSSWTHIAFDFPFSINYSQCFFNSILDFEIKPKSWRDVSKPFRTTQYVALIWCEFKLWVQT